MKNKHLLTTLCILLFSFAGSMAQQKNVLSIPDVGVQSGHSISLPIQLDNTTDIVAVEFDLSVPDGISLSCETATLSERSDGHTVTMRPMDANKYKVMIFSSSNKAILGRTGELMSVSLNASASLMEGTTFQMTLSDVVIGGRNGENYTTGYSAGTITISKSPVLTISEVSTSSTTIVPGDKAYISWNVSNVGGLSTPAGWREQIYLETEDGTSKLIGTVYHDKTLDAGGTESRSAEISVPAVIGMDGPVYIRVKLKASSDAGEPAWLTGNSEARSSSMVNIAKLLVLSPDKINVEESSNGNVRFQLTRSGSTSKDGTFSLLTTADTRVTLPASITIPQGQSGTYFYAQIKANNVMDDLSEVNMTISGNDYPEVVGHIEIEDDTYPKLEISSNQQEVTEGGDITFTITAERAPKADLEIKLSSDHTSHFSIPSTITLKAGQTSVDVVVNAIEDNIPNVEEVVQFTASAAGYQTAAILIALIDNDMPTFTFSLTPETVSESDGYSAIFGVIRRTDNIDKRVTFKLSDDSNGLISLPANTIVMEKNQTEVQFSIGVVDNDIVDGNHVVTVTAAVYVSSCNCSASGDSKGAKTATVTIIDDDGPTLKIKPVGTSMLEGSEGNVFVISHNVSSDKDIKVKISSDNDDMLEYDHELVIPAGQTTVNLLVNVKSNDKQDDSSIATFKVEADGYAMGTCWLLITDQTLPDAIVSLYVDKTEVEAADTVLLSAVVKNVGNSLLAENTPLEITFSGGKETVKLTVGKSVAVGDSVVIDYKYDLPAITGKYTFEATVNASQKVPELIYANNSSEKVAITLLSPFTTTAQADKDIYKQGENITITGVVTGSASKNANVEIYIINDGTRQTISATSDADGNYSVNWQPLSKQSGHFIIGACYPGSQVMDEMDAFDVYGIKAKDNWTTCELGQTETISGKIVITNPGNLAQTGLTVTPKFESDNCEFAYDVPSSIGVGESVEIGYTIKGNGVSEGRDWQQMPIEISTAEGSRIDYTLYYFVFPLKAKLDVNSTFINTTMAMGSPREYPIVVRNIGRGETGKITLALPDWIQPVTPIEMASLAQGDSATIVLRFTSTEDMKLNIPIKGYISANCENGDGVSISFNITPVSEIKGTLKVDVIDEYTYFTSEAPHVSKAKVQITNPSTNEVVVEGETADDGIFRTEIPEGYYSIKVNADKHKSYTNTVIVDPGVEKLEEVFLSYEAITYEWDVVETEIEDEYELETVVEYETTVPKPVVIITLPNEQPKPNTIIPVVVTNKGLVNALDFNLSLYVNDGYTLEFLNDFSLDILAPQQSHVFYAKLLLNDDARCLKLKSLGIYKEPCEKNPNMETTVAEKQWGNCSSNTTTGGSTGGSTGGMGAGSGSGNVYLPNSPSIWGNNNYDYNDVVDNYVEPTKQCERTENGNICTTITLSIKERAVMTRQAFRGTLTVNNGNETTPMTDVKLTIEVRDTDENLATSHEFQINAESLNGFSGNIDLTSGWTLDGGETGIATVLFIPTKYAAPTEPTDYSFGGSFSYTDPYTGLTVTRDLNPVTLTVNPSPNLDLTYFMQRDVFGDDPLTETVEPMIPSEFALIVNNKGYGDAENMSLTTQQPEIIDNQQGNAITFKLISSQLNGGEKNLSLGGSMISDFGTIPAHSQAYAQWWLQSSQLGHFTEYNVKATHLTSRNNPDLSLIDTVTIHELIHGFTVNADGEIPLRGFLVNDIKDKDDLPDEIYFTDATQQSVYQTTNADITKLSDTEYMLNVSVGTAGWNYGSLPDPTYGMQSLAKIVCSNGTEVNLDNIWQTDRTLRDGKDPLYENRIHFIGNMPSQGETYILTFEPRPELELAVEGYKGVPEENTVLKEQLTEVTVKFNKPIKAETFTAEDISINCQGAAQDASQITITKVNEQEYKLGLAEVTLADGYYVLTVQTANIEDAEGFTGSTGKQTSWIQFVDGKVALKLTASPAEGGTISPASGRFDYDSDVTVKATPAEGYDFVAWRMGDANVSTDRAYTYHLMDNTELKALFSIKHYFVDINYDSTEGTVEGVAPGGIYDYGTQLQLIAIPAPGYEFDAWLINEEREAETESYTITVNSDMIITALFKEQIPDAVEMVNEDKLNVKITPIPVSDMMYISGNFEKLDVVNIYDMSGVKHLTARNVQPNQGISVGRLSAGIYYVQIVTDRGVHSAKIVKH